MTDRLRADPPVGGTLSYIDSLVPSLVPSEQRVAREIVEHAQEVSLMSVADIASRVGTSPATVIRACQSLGFKGFQHLRLLLLRDAPGHARLTPADSSGDGASRDWLPALFRSAGEELVRALGPLDFDEFDRAVAAITEAKRLMVVGNGGSGPMAQLLSFGLMSSGRPNEAPADSVVQQLTARSLTGEDACVCISSSGTNSATLRVAEAADQAGAAVVGVTGFLRTRLEEISAITLVCHAYATDWVGGTLSGNVAQVVLFAGLQAAVSVALGKPATDPAVLEEAMTVLEGELGQDTE